MTIALPLPAPHPDSDRWPSRALSSAHDFKIRHRKTLEDPPLNTIILPSIQGRTWKSNHGKDSNPNSMPTAKNVASDGKNRHKLKSNADKNTFKSVKKIAGSVGQLTSHASPHNPQFTANSKRPKPKIKSGDHSEVMYIQHERGKLTTGHVLSKGDSSIGKIKGISRSIKLDAKANIATKQHGKLDNTKTRDLKKHFTVSKNEEAVVHSKTKGKQKESIQCPSFNQQDILESDHRKIRVSEDLREVPWFSEDDLMKMKLLAEGGPVSKARVPAHGQVLQVALETAGGKQTLLKSPKKTTTMSHTDHCHIGQCSLVKRTDDWFEVFAFHLDRVLGLNRSLPAVLRSFHSEILPYRYIRGDPRPVVWWDPHIQHLEDDNNDQNSVPLSYVQYQKMLKAHCGTKTGLKEEPCVGVNHSEWSKLAMFDFLLQVNDRLDRYCCGFAPDPSDMCVENMLHSKCGNTKDQHLVHILVRKADPSRLVFIDNAGRPRQPIHNLNFRLLEGIDQFPERAVSVLQSGCLEALLLRSLYADKEFWTSRGGAGGLRPLIQTVEERGEVLLQHIRDRKIPLNTDL